MKLFNSIAQFGMLMLGMLIHSAHSEVLLGVEPIRANINQTGTIQLLSECYVDYDTVNRLQFDKSRDDEQYMAGWRNARRFVNVAHLKVQRYELPSNKVNQFITVYMAQGKNKYINLNGLLSNSRTNQCEAAFYETQRLE